MAEFSLMNCHLLIGSKRQQKCITKPIQSIQNESLTRNVGANMLVALKCKPMDQEQRWEINTEVFGSEKKEAALFEVIQYYSTKQIGLGSGLNDLATSNPYHERTTNEAQNLMKHIKQVNQFKINCALAWRISEDILMHLLQIGKKLSETGVNLRFSNQGKDHSNPL